ncbi:cupin domain-containing protein [Patescibacteria group bacterium]|nr:cupin domain-containing protein [Patescibacteria group bacterium]
MKGYTSTIEYDTLENTNFRKVVYTAQHSQLVLMSLKPLEEIGLETHSENDQFFRFEAGEGKVIINGVEHTVTDGSAVIIPAGAAHNVINTSQEQDLKMYTIYSPAHHKDGVVHATKHDAEQDDEEFDGVTTE